MNLFRGKLSGQETRRDILQNLPAALEKALCGPPLPAEVVIGACGRLGDALGEGDLALLEQAGIAREAGRRLLQEAKELLNEKYLRMHLAHAFGEEGEGHFCRDGVQVTETLQPLGVLLHITAGNQEGLGALSVLEGLLTGNINVVKPSGKDSGISALVLHRLCEEEPRLADHLIVVECPSGETQTMLELIHMANAVVVWGGDGAISGVRQLVPPHIPIIEWGHRLSFAYVTQAGATEEGLAGIAENMVETNQLLCSSCQGIFLDTTDREAVYAFCRRFLPILQKRRQASPLPITVAAQGSLRCYAQSLELGDKGRLFRGVGCSVTAHEDTDLTASSFYGHCWVRALPRIRLVGALHGHKGHLQTAALLCSDLERADLTALLFRAGVTRVTAGENMSRTYSGAAHDGVMALHRYVRRVSVERPIPRI